MKIINEKLFGVLYDELYIRLENNNGNLDGLGIKSTEVINYLQKLWYLGKLWDMITIIICYHYSRGDCAIIKFSGQSISLSQKISLQGIINCLGLTKIKEICISLDNFIDDYEKLDKMFPKVYKGKAGKIGNLLSELGITPNQQGILIKTWKEEKRWETIVAVFVLLKTKYFSISIETDRGKYKFNKNINPLQILEEFI